MEKPLFEILRILNASPADYIILTMGIVVVLYIISLSKRLKVMEDKYHALDKSNVRLWDRVDPDMVSDHHTGDYSIKQRKEKNVREQIPSEQPMD